MNYGPNGINNNSVVASDRLSFDVTEIAVAHFNSAVGCRTRETIDRLDVGRAADITRKASCAVLEYSRSYSGTLSARKPDISEEIATILLPSHLAK